MNGNRSRYSSNPTFNMQKRGMFKKSPQLVTERPDFSVQQDAGAVSQTLFSQPAPIQNPSMQGPAYPPAADLFSVPANSSMGMQGTPPMGIATGYQQNLFQGQQPSMQSQAPSAFGIQPPQTNYPFGQPAGNLPPLGNQNMQNPNASFSPHAQGFTPPQINQPAQSSFFGGMNQSPQQPIGAPIVQPATPFDPSPMAQQPYQRNQFIPQQSMQPNAAGYNGMPSAATDPDTLWKLFLFVLLPVLFIPCLFVPDSLNVLRYIFIALCAAGIGVIWYRKMFSDNGRIAATLIYAVACVALLVMLFGGVSSDKQQADPNAAQQQVAETFGINGNADGTGDAAQPTFSPTPEPTPTVAPISEAQIRLEAFMTNWSGARIEDMVRLVQPSWASSQDNPSNRLFVMLGNRTPLNYTIEEISGSDNDSSRTVTMTANIDKNNGKDPILYRFMVLMVKEGGEWYIDPNSLASNDEVKNSEETNVVNDSQNTTAENWTIAPRQTVTPAPSGSQLLYFNPNGGSKYHLDQYCPSIYDEFLPLEGSFPYSELGSHRDLSPCLRCNAPTQTLPPENLGGDSGI